LAKLAIDLTKNAINITAADS